MELLYVGLGVLTAVGALAIWRGRREARDAAAFADAKELNLHLPASLHPEIDTTICIGSLSCLRACPEGDILGVVDGAARLIRGANCIGHGRCALECPVGAIRLVFGTAERGVDLPEVDANFQSSRAGVHIVGELGGMGLIRNAVTQGREAAEALAARRPPTPPGGVDVAIVGSGPAGLAAALACRHAGLTVRVLEQDTVGGTIAHYPRRKLVMTDPLELPFFGRLRRNTLSKEELLELWHRAIARGDLEIAEGMKVVGLEGTDGDFTVLTEKGPVRAAKVVLATGRRGSPRKLGVPGEDAEKVSYRLLEPDQFQGRRVLVVGGGDSALEAALAIAQESDAQVALSYRGAALGKCREANREKFEAAVAAGRIRALLGTQVTRIDPEQVSLQGAESAALTLPNDDVLVLIGGELPLDFLKKMGVELRRFHGQEHPAHSATVSAGARESRAQAEERKRRRLAILLGVLGLSILALLALRGGDYYLLRGAARLKAAGHSVLRPAGLWGHGVGLVATAFMLSNFLYALRKRLGFLKGRTTIRRWLTFHMFVGFMSPLVIAFHAAFQANNQLAQATLAALLIVVGTGVIGRFLFGLVPAEGDSVLGQAEVLAELERSRAQVQTLVGDRASELLRGIGDAPPRSFLGALARMATSRVRLAFRLRPLRAVVDGPAHFDELRAGALRLVRLQVQAAFLRTFRRLLAGWRLFHSVLAVFLVLVIAAHVAISLYLGYRWIF